MKRSSFILLSMNIVTVFMRHQKPVHKLLWSEHCTRNAVALNDCNWCWCDNNNQYACHARICSDVDMFGHFNDAIRDVDPGMEGHGVWRSTDTACEPGVHYRKSALLCVCNEDGTWPNPVCRDIFQILHAVEVTQYPNPAENQSCSPSKLHLIGCNVCICPSSGTINPKYCTNRNCNEETEERPKEIRVEEDAIDEIYATCNPEHNYKLGCKSCVCLRNNRLLCDNCTTESSEKLRKRTSLCSGTKLNTLFKDNCNLCYCDSENTMYCSTKKCLKNEEINVAKQRLSVVSDKLVDRPLHNEDCIPGTTFKKDCNICHCFIENGVKSIGCTMKQCSSGTDLDPNGDCVVGTTYEENCLKCYCEEENGVKQEVCVKDAACTDDSDEEIKSLDSMHGYCEPLHTYMKDCNRCRCLSDGKTVACTANICPKDAPRPIVTELLPIIQQQPDCPEGHAYKVDCNYCFCMKNGNAICTPLKCKRGF